MHQSANASSLIFILGGARSGKSDYALECARQLAGAQAVLFIATAQAGDGEMAERIARHRTERPDHWQTLEAPLNVGATLTAHLAQAEQPAAIVVDCLTLLVSNLLFASADVESDPYLQIQGRMDAEISALLAAVKDAKLPRNRRQQRGGLGHCAAGAHQPHLPGFDRARQPPSGSGGGSGDLFTGGDSVGFEGVAT